MPLYTIQHSYPLTRAQKDQIASGITKLHSTRFLTPSLFVNVIFTVTEPVGDFYLAGKAVKPVPPNRIFAGVRTGPRRTKEVLDDTALLIEQIWYDAVNDVVKPGTKFSKEASNGPVNDGSRAHPTETNDQESAKKLHFIAFTPVMAGLENGVLLPSADNEGAWLSKNMAFFKEQAEVHGHETFAELLKEIQERPELRKMLA